MSQIIGVIPILATPFNKNGDINFKDYEKECEFLINSDVNGIINTLLIPKDCKIFSFWSILIISGNFTRDLSNTCLGWGSNVTMEEIIFLA